MKFKHNMGIQGRCQICKKYFEKTNYKQNTCSEECVKERKRRETRKYYKLGKRRETEES